MSGGAKEDSWQLYLNWAKEVHARESQMADPVKLELKFLEAKLKEIAVTSCSECGG